MLKEFDDTEAVKFDEESSAQTAENAHNSTKFEITSVRVSEKFYTILIRLSLTDTFKTSTMSNNLSHLIVCYHCHSSWGQHLNLVSLMSASNILLMMDPKIYFQAAQYGTVMLIDLDIKRIPDLFRATIVQPVIGIASLIPVSLILPPDSEAKLDIQITSVLAFSVYMMIVVNFIPPYLPGQSPEIGEFGVSDTLP